MKVIQATIFDLEKIATLFDLYRQFYGKTSDLNLSRTFISERIANNQSIIFVALSDDEAPIGFTQLYPSFSSLSAGRTLILNDLFVLSQARKSGVGTTLLKAAENYAKAIGAIGLSLSTAVKNEAAQKLYAQNGWLRDQTYCTYEVLINC